MARSPSRARSFALNTIGVFFGVAALYHLAVIARPSVGSGGSPARHGVFVVVNALVALGLFARPRFFFWFFTALALQQLHSHGSALFREWAVMHRIDLPSVLVLVIVPLTWVLLWSERHSRSTPPPTGP